MRSVQTGNLAENAVAAELRKRGYKIVEQNWKTKFAEIDIVAEKDKVLYFVEVKYRKTMQAGDGFDYITPQKLHHMQRAADAWASTNHWHGEYLLLAASAIGDLEELTVDIREV